MAISLPRKAERKPAMKNPDLIPWEKAKKQLGVKDRDP
jgi:hypothetical protein